jgi:hypothetical protein
VPRGSRDLDVMQRGVPGLDGLLVPHQEDSRSPGPRQAHRWSPTTRMLLVRTYASTCRADHQREILATGVASRHPSSCAGANKRCRVVPRWQSSVLAPHKTCMARDGEQGKVHVSTTWVLVLNQLTMTTTRPVTPWFLSRDACTHPDHLSLRKERRDRTLAGMSVRRCASSRSSKHWSPRA